MQRTCPNALPEGLVVLSADKLWNSTAPAAVVAAYRSQDAAAGWDAWRCHLAQRREPRELAETLPGPQHPLFWSLPDEALSAWPGARGKWMHSLLAAATITAPAIQRRLTHWLDDVAVGEPGVAYAIEALVWCHSLPRLASMVAPQLWWRLVDHLLQGDAPPLAHALLAGELPLTLWAWLPELAACRRAGVSARTVLTAALHKLCNGRGCLPHAGHLSMLRPLLACYTRARVVAADLAGGSWGPRADRQYHLLVDNALRLTRPDGTQVLCRDRAGDWNAPLFAAAVGCRGENTQRRLAQERLPGCDKSTARRLPADRPSVSLHCEESAASILCADWNRGSPQLSLQFAEDPVQMELLNGGEILWSGPWQMQVQLDGRPLAPVSKWREIVWLSDKDVDYLELELCLTAGLRVQRHILLAKQERFVFLADAVLGVAPAKLHYRGVLPLAPAVEVRSAEDMRECFLFGRQRQALVLPLALPEWRCDRQWGDLTASGGLVLQQQSQGQNLFAPLFVDLDRRRMTRGLTWRQLTVGEDRHVVPRDRAVGYRVQVGREQWIVYRSLARPGNRTLLGHNLVSETLLGRFTGKGLVESLVEIEGMQSGQMLAASPPHVREAHIGEEKEARN